MGRKARRSETPDELWRRTIEMDQARADRKRAQQLFDRTLDVYMQTGGREASADQLLQAARKLWQARDRLRRLLPDRPKGDEIPRDQAVPRVAPRRVTRVVSGGLPGQKRRG